MKILGFEPIDGGALKDDGLNDVSKAKGPQADAGLADAPKAREAAPQAPMGGGKRRLISFEPIEAPKAPESEPKKSMLAGVVDVVKEEGAHHLTNLKIGWNALVGGYHGASRASKTEELRKLEQRFTPEQLADDSTPWPSASPGGHLVHPEFQLPSHTYKGPAAYYRALKEQIGEHVRGSDEVRADTQKLRTQMRPSTQEFFNQAGQGWTVENLSRIGEIAINNPVSLVTDLGVQSAPASVAIVAAAVLSRYGGGSRTTAAMVGGMASALLEFGNDYAERRYEGASHEEAYSKAARKAAAVGAFDALSLRSAGRAIDEALEASGILKKAGAIAKETGRQAAYGMAGEGVGSILAGEVPDPVNLAAEGLGEIGPGVLIEGPAMAGKSLKDAFKRDKAADTPTASNDAPADGAMPADEVMEQPAAQTEQAAQSGDSAPAQEAPERAQPTAQGVEALWTVNGVDQPVTVTEYVGTQHGEDYFAVAGSGTAVPRSQLNNADDAQILQMKDDAIVAEIERLAAEGKTSVEIDMALGDALAARGDGMARRDYIRAVRQQLGIPFRDQPEFEQWLAGYRARPKRPMKFRADAQPMPQEAPQRMTREEYQRRQREVLPDDSLFTAIAKLGGINREELVSSWGIDPATVKGLAPVFGKPVARASGGRTLDEMAELLHEAGYLDARDLREFEDKFDRELRGQPVHSIHSDAAMADEMARRAELEAEQAAGTDPTDFDLTPEELAETGYNDLSDEEQQAVMALVQQLRGRFEGTDAESAIDEIIERAAIQAADQPASAFRELIILNLREYIGGSENTEQQPAQGERGEDGQDGQGDAAQAAGQGAGREATADEEGQGVDAGTPSLELEAPSPESLRLKDEARRLREQAEARKRAAPPPEEFTLTGSDRPTDQAAARGQMELVPAAAPQPYTPPEIVEGPFTEALPGRHKEGSPLAEIKIGKDKDGKWRMTTSVQTSNYGETGPYLSTTYSSRDAARAAGIARLRERVGAQRERTDHSQTVQKELDRILTWLDSLEGKASIADEVKRLKAKKPKADAPKADKGRIVPKRTADGGVRFVPEPMADLKAEAAKLKEQSAEAKARADLEAALADLGDLLSKNVRKNITPEQEQQLLPILTRVFDAAFRLGYIKFKQAARFVRNTIREKLGNDIADLLTLEHYQGAYIAMSGKYRAQGAESLADVGKVAALTELDEEAQQAATSHENDLPMPTEAQKQAGNYRKGHIKVAGFDIAVENPAGSWRWGVDTKRLAQARDELKRASAADALQEVEQALAAFEAGRPQEGINHIEAAAQAAAHTHGAIADVLFEIHESAWAVQMQDHYGYIKRTEGADGDHVDVFVKVGTPADYDGPVFVVDQVKQGNRHFDEHKVMIGWPDAESARIAYHANYSAGWTGFRAISQWSIDQFREWVQGPGATKPAALATPVTWVESTPDNPIIYASGLSRAKDFKPALAAGRSVGIDINEMSIPALEELGEALAQSPGAYVFIDSGAFSVFRANLRAAASGQFSMEEFGSGGKALDFDEIFERYDALASTVARHDDSGDANARLFFVMPDIVGDQQASFELAERYRERVRDYLSFGNPIIPIQVGPKSLADAYTELTRILGRDDLIIGVPSNEKAAPPDQIRELFERHGDVIAGVHFLGAASAKKLNPKLDLLRAAGYDGPTSADANMLRSRLYGDTDRATALRKLLGSDAGAPVPASDSERVRLAQFFAALFADGNRLDISQARKLAETRLGRPVKPGTPDAKLADEAIELGVSMAARRIIERARGERMPIADLYERMVALYEQQPNLNVRTSTSIEQQAYSTPVPLAFLASQLADIDWTKSVYEPSAGNGLLLIEAAQSAYANELNPERAAALRALGFQTTQADAVNHLPPEKVDVVIANPPFGVVKRDGQTVRYKVRAKAAPGGVFETGEIDHAIAFKALEAMKDDGRAVLIVGSINKLNVTPEARQEAYNSAAKRKFYFALYDEYNVVDHFTVKGDLYAKQGAGWPVDVIVIHGRGKATRPLPAVELPQVFDSWDGLKEKLDARLESEARTADGSDHAAGGPAADGRSRRVQPRPDSGSGDLFSGLVGTSDPDGAGQSGAATASRGDAGPRGDQRRAGDRSGGSGRSADLQQSGRAGTAAPDGRAVTTGTGVDVGRSAGAQSDQGNRPATVGASPDGQSAGSGVVTQVPYKPVSRAASVDTLVPVNLQTAIADSLNALVERVGDIDSYVAEKLGYKPEEVGKYFSAEQLDALALTIDNMERGAGFIIGDQTGIGKGRVVAGVIRYALQHGKTPIFVTEKPNLYGDMYRDLSDIGMSDVSILMTNAGERVPLDDTGTKVLKTEAAAKHNALLADLAADGTLREYDVIFTTYNQLQTVQQRRTPRMDFVEAFARGGIVIFDESHNAGGSETEVRGQANKLDRAAFARQIAGIADGVFYSSATYAKRPSVMDLYFKTDMKLAVKDIKDLAPAIQAGGVPLQQVVAAMLTRAGQYIRRERSFAGINYNTVVAKVDREAAERVSTILRRINTWDTLYKGPALKRLRDEVRKEAKKVTVDGSVGQAGVHSTNFTAIMHNLIDQMLLALKAGPAVDRAIEALKGGEKVVLTVANTMGSFIEQFTEENGINPGEAVDLSFGDLLVRYLDRSREVLVGDAFGAKTRIRLSDEQLGAAGAAEFRRLRTFIMKSGLRDIPISPIDYMKSRIKQAGYKVEEITGRGHILEYGAPSEPPHYRIRPGKETSIAGRRQALTRFNNGQADVMVLNQAGSTGLSLHASSKFRDQRKRRMIIVQAEKNIDTHMQMLGRINRTGQVVLPEYDQLVADIPAEKRPAAVLAKKMASLNANTTAARGSALTSSEVLDFMNDYGDEVVAAIMTDDEDLHRMLGSPLERDEATGGFSKDGAVRKVTGRIPLLTLKQQEELYDLIEQEYRDRVARADAMGENALEAKTLPLEARTVGQVRVFEGSGESPFAQSAELELVDAKRLGKPHTPEQLDKILRVNLQAPEGATNLTELGRRAADERLRAINAAYDPYMMERHAEAMAGAEDPERAARAWQTQSLRMEDMKRRLERVLLAFHEGAQVMLSNDLMEMPAIVTEVKRTGTAKNPVALGAWKITFAIPDAMRSITLSAKQVDVPIPEAPQENDVIGRAYDAARDPRFHEADIYDEFRKAQSVSREPRWIVTGNLLAGFGQFKQGQIVNFTDNEGRVRQGILMPKTFKPSESASMRQLVFANPSQIMRFMRAEIGRNRVEDETGSILLTSSHNDWQLRVPAAKDKGAFIYLDQTIREYTGDFVKRGNSMFGRMYEHDVEAVLARLGELGVSFRPANAFDTARDIIGATDDTKNAIERLEKEAEKLVGLPSRPHAAESIAPYNRAHEVSQAQRVGEDRAQQPSTPDLFDPLSDLYAASPVPGTTSAYEIHQYRVEPAQVGELAIGVERVTTPEEAAHVFAAIRKAPRERFQALVTDADGKPLAYMDLFSGAVTQTAVYPDIVAKAVYQTPGARRVWFAHNHPSGTPQPSSADHNLALRLEQSFGEDFGVEVGGHLVIAGTQAAMYWSGGGYEAVRIKPAARKHRVPITERVVRKAGRPGVGLLSPADVKGFYRQMEPKEPGLVLLDAQNRVRGWYPMSLEQMARLRTGSTESGVAKLFADMGRLNSVGAFVFVPKLDEAAMSAINNVASALTSRLDMRVLDGVGYEGSVLTSMAERGRMSISRAFFSRGSGRAGLPRMDGEAVVTRLRLNLPFAPETLVLDDYSQAPHELRERIEQDLAERRAAGVVEPTIEGAFHNGKVYAFLNALPDLHAAEFMLAHEYTHAGLRRLMGGELDAVLLGIYHANVGVQVRVAQLRATHRHMPVVEATYEVLADIGAEILTGARKRPSWWSQLVSAIRDFLRRVGFVTQFTDDDVTSLVVSAQRTLKRDPRRRTHLYRGTAFHRAGGARDDAPVTGEPRYSIEPGEPGATLRGHESSNATQAEIDALLERIARFTKQSYPPGSARPVALPAGIERIANAFGVRAVGIRPAEGAPPIPQGVFLGNTLYISEKTNRPHLAVLGHELVHGLRRAEPELFEEFKAAVRPYVRNYPAFYERMRSYGYGANPATAAEEIREEFLAEIVADGFLNERFWRALGDHNPSLLRRIADYVRMLILHAIEAFKGYKPRTEKYLSDFDRVMEIAGNVMARYGESVAQNAGGQATPPAFDLTNQPTLAQRVEAALTKKRGVAAPLEAAARTVSKYTGLTFMANTAYDLLLKMGAFVPEKVKAGVVADYGIPEAVLDRRDAMFGRQRQQLRNVQHQLERLMHLTRAESRVAYEWMTRNDADADALLEQLPEDSRELLRELKGVIDKMGQEAVRLGQLSADAYERHKLAYLHRSYKKWDLDATPQQKASRARAIRILGDQYKGRGIVDPVDMSRIQNAAPGFWQRKLKEGAPDVALKGQRFIRFERRAHSGEGTAEMFEGGKRQGRLLEVHYWPAGEAVPAKYGDWVRDDSLWEVRGVKGRKLLMWRDFTAAERERMGEIDEVRYAFAKTMQLMVHDLEVGRYLEWLSSQYAKPEPQGKVIEASENMRAVFEPGTWVQVPSTKIAGTSVARYGKLAGLYLPGPIWNDVRQVVNWRYQPLGETYDTLLRAWKISKTALSPAVHMNNVMANVIMADWHDVRAAHLAKAMEIIVAGGIDPKKKGLSQSMRKILSRTPADEARRILERFEDAGGAVGTYAMSELQREQLAPLIERLHEEVHAAESTNALINASAVLQALLRGRFREAIAAAGQSRSAVVVKKAGQAMIDLYQAEDVVFRLAAFIRAKGEGKSDIEAGKVARKSFLDYNINAPWIQAMRSTVFPFISFTYRAVPMMLETMGRKPWKMLKLATVLGTLNALGYMLSGGDEDDERKRLPEEKRGQILGFLGPKLIRMPWNDEHDSPVFLDIRRFIPVGDIVDVDQTNSAIPILPSMQPSGPLVMFGELLMNRSMFTGKPITKETDTATEKAQKVLAHLYKGAMPNLPIAPGTYSFDAIARAGGGETDDFGRERSLSQALLSSVGIKVASYPEDQARKNLRAQQLAREREISENIGGLRRQLRRGGISRDEFDAKMAREIEKRKDLRTDYRERMQ